MFHRFFADNTNERSIASRLRKRRIQLFLEMLDNIPGEVQILDIGGTQKYWEMMALDSTLMAKIQITLLNTQPQTTSYQNFTSVVGDARNMPQFSDNQFNIVFSNSTIEHVGNYSDQKNMAEEVKRIGNNYFIQTPNRNFPIEPHFVFPFFQFLPIRFRVWLVRHFKLGWFPKMNDYQQALAEVKGIRLLTKSEYKKLFPEAELFEEKYLGLTKSFIAYTPQEQS
jgi:hypothetical protein